MDISQIAGDYEVGGGGATLGGSGSQNPFLDLIVTELQNQNPLEPVSNNEFLGQLAQFSTLEQMEALNANLAKQALFTQFGQAANLVGKNVSYIDSAGEPRDGRVDSVLMQGSTVFAEINGEAVSIDSVIRVFAEDEAKPANDGNLPPEADEADDESTER